MKNPLQNETLIKRIWQFLFKGLIMWFAWSMFLVWLTIKVVYLYLSYDPGPESLTYTGAFENLWDFFIHLEEITLFSTAAVTNVILICAVLFLVPFVQKIVLPGYDEIRDALADWRTFRDLSKSDEGMTVNEFEAGSKYFGNVILAAAILSLGSLLLVAGVFIAVMIS